MFDGLLNDILEARGIEVAGLIYFESHLIFLSKRTGQVTKSCPSASSRSRGSHKGAPVMVLAWYQAMLRLGPYLSVYETGGES